MAAQSHTAGTGISQLDTEILRLRTYSLSMHDEILKGVNDANEEVRENINAVANDINYGRSRLRADLETMKIDCRNQYTSIQSTLSMMESFINHHEFTRRQPQFAPGMREANSDRLKVPCQQHGTNKNQEHGDNKSQEAGTSNSKCTSKYSPFSSRPPKLGPDTLPKHKLSFNVVKRKNNGIGTKGSSMLNKKPSVTFNVQDDPVNPQLALKRDIPTQVSAARESWPDSQMHDILTPPANDFPDSKVSEAQVLRPDSQMHDILTPRANYFPDSKVSEAHELRPDSQMYDIPTLPSKDFEFNVPRKKTSRKKTTDDAYPNPFPVPDSKVSEAHELRLDSQMHDIPTLPSKDFEFNVPRKKTSRKKTTGDAYLNPFPFPDSKVSEAHELRPDSQMHDILTSPSNDFEFNVHRENTSLKKTAGDAYINPFPVPDSTPSDYATQTPRRVISKPLPNQPRSRRPTQLPCKLKKDFVDPSTRQRNKRRRYDPFRPIELDNWLSFRDWYNNPKAEDKTIEGIYYNFKSKDVADPCWFETIYKPQGWLGISHVNAYMLLLRDRMETHPISFKSNACIFSHELSVFLTEAKTRKPSKPDTRVTSVLNELRMLNRDSIVYTPWVHASHWVALVISIPLWKITVYDCMYIAGINSEMDNKLQDIATFLSLTLKLNDNFSSDPRTSQPFLVEKLDQDACPQMEFPGDCGVFTAKFIEHMILKDIKLNDVTQENMEVFREKMCIDIFHHIVDV